MRTRILIVVFIAALGCLPSPAGAVILFDARLDHWCPDQADSAAAADLDGNGTVDVALVTGGLVTVRLGQGDGTFEDDVTYHVGFLPESVIIGDLDLDGVPDLVVTFRGWSPDFTGGVAVLLGNGDGSFQSNQKYFAGNNGRMSVIGDFNEDGSPDLAMTHGGDFPDPGGVALFMGNGDGTFPDALLVTCGEGTNGIAAGDLDGDDHLDLVATNLETHDLSILLGLGNGTFQPAVSVPAGEGPASVAIRDFDADGARDLAVTDAWENVVMVLRGNGNGTFQPETQYPVAGNPQNIVAEDINGDGDTDLATPGYTGRSLSVLRGNGDGTFQERTDHWVSAAPKHCIAVDLNGDGAADLLTANYGNFPGNVGSFSVLLGLGGGAFREAPTHAVGLAPREVVSADLNRDGLMDLALAYGDPSEMESGISILLGAGGGAFQEAADIPYGEWLTTIAADDFDRDGNPDLVVPEAGSKVVSVFLGNGDGTFQPPLEYTGLDGVGHITTGDLNGDAIPDLAVGNPASDDIVVLLGNGDGTFQSSIENPLDGNAGGRMVIADLNHDTVADLLAVDWGGNEVYVFLGNGDGTLQQPASYGTGYGPVGAAVGDLDGDGHPDMAVTIQYRETVMVRFGNGDGTFGSSSSLDVDDTPVSIAMGFIDNDDTLDLVTANTIGNNITVLPGTGNGGFGPAQNYGAGSFPCSVVAEDLDNDGDPDLAVANSVGNDVSILFNIAHTDRLVVAGPGPAPDNPPLVRGFPTRHGATAVTQFQAYAPERFGVNVGCGDLTGDGRAEILTGAGPGEIYGPHVRGFQVNGTPLPGLSFLAYGTLKYGVNVAMGELDGDGYNEIITGAGPGAVFGPHVRAFDYDGTPGVTAVPGVSFFAYGTPKWGVNVAAGDIDGDGFDEIVTGAGPGAVYGPHVRGWNIDGGAAAAIPGVSFLAYGTNRHGVNVTAGDVDGDGIDEIVTGPGPSSYFAAHVRGWNYDGASLAPIPGISFFAWDPGAVRYGARVFAGADLDDDGRADLVVGQGPDPGAGAEVNVYTCTGSTVTHWFSLNCYPGLGRGVNVAAGRL